MINISKKRGQFYFIAAIIIASLIFGLVSISNYSQKSKDFELENLKSEIQIESEKVLDYGNYNKLTSNEINSLLEDFSKDYISSKKIDKNLYFIFGKKSNLRVVAYQSESENANITLEEETNLNIFLKQVFVQNFSTSQNTITLTTDNSYKFKLKEGENFYFVISKKQGDEKYVVKN